MRLTPTERDRLLLFGAAELARARRARGLRLNVPEATALIADTVCEAARDGAAARRGHRGGPRPCSAPTTCCPACPTWSPRSMSRPSSTTAPGSRWCSDPIGGTAGAGRPRRAAARRRLPGGGPRGAGSRVTNTATVPVSVTSHFHFFEANPRLDFDRAAAYGMRLCVPAGSSVRFGPGESERGRPRPDRRRPRRHRVRGPGRRARWTRPAPRRRPCAGPPPADTWEPAPSARERSDGPVRVRRRTRPPHRRPDPARGLGPDRPGRVRLAGPGRRVPGRLRQDRPRRAAPEGRRRPRDLRRRHQQRRRDRRGAGHPQGVHRHPRGADLLDRAGREPRHPRRRGRRRRHRHLDRLRRGAHRHRRSRRHPRPPAVAAHHGGLARLRRHHDHRPGVRPGLGRRRQLALGAAGRLRRLRRLAGQHRLPGPGFVLRRRPAGGGARRGRGLRVQGPRGHGRAHPGARHRAARRRGARRPGRPAQRRVERVPHRRGHPEGARRPHHPRLPHRGLRRRPRTQRPEDGGRRRTSSAPPPTPPCPSAGTRSPSTTA